MCGSLTYSGRKRVSPMQIGRNTVPVNCAVRAVRHCPRLSIGLGRRVAHQAL